MTRSASQRPRAGWEAAKTSARSAWWLGWSGRTVRLSAPPPDLFEKYREAVTIPEHPDGHFERMHPYHQRFRERSRIADATEHEIRRTRAAYYGMVEFDDRLVGQVLDTLEANGQRENTLVVYTSDHGEMAGDHGLWWKMSLYEGSAGVPLVASMPGTMAEGIRAASPVSLTDIGPTLADVAGAAKIPGATGQSFAAQLRGEPGDPNRRAVSEMLVNSHIWPEVGPSRGPMRMLRRGDWKCNYYHGERPELFNLAEDPRERCDRYDDPECAEILRAMTAELLADWDPERLQAECHAQREAREVLRAAPGDPTRALPGEHWMGPEGYGYVEPS